MQKAVSVSAYWSGEDYRLHLAIKTLNDWLDARWKIVSITPAIAGGNSDNVGYVSPLLVIIEKQT